MEDLDELRKRFRGWNQVLTIINEVERLRPFEESFRAAFDECRDLHKEIDRLRLKQCTCQCPSWGNTGGTMSQCGHCGGWGTPL